MTPEQIARVKPTSVKLEIPRSGSGRLTRIEGEIVPREIGVTIAAWQTPEKGAPKRVVVRCDGKITDQAATKNSDGSMATPGFPMAVLKVEYSIGGIQKNVLIDAGGQSALTLWCESVEVTPVWDERRIERSELGACSQQLLAATINSDQTVGDTGPADARWIDALHLDETTGTEPNELEWSIHPIPEGARGVRFLDTLINGEMASVPALTSIIAWSADTFDVYPFGSVQFNTNGATDTSILIVPTAARFLFIAFPSGTFDTFDIVTWLEWIMSPNTLPGY